MDAARLAHWLWRSPSPVAAVSRLALLPVAVLYRAGTIARNAAFSHGLGRIAPLPAPSIGVGNLAVGGTGKTPIATWLAGELARRGVRPGIVLRGYGADELAAYRAALGEVPVEASADRVVAAEAAVRRGARTLVLDDCLQHRRVWTDVMLAVVAAETWSGARWPLPAGPWREGASALRRADAVIVTRKYGDPGGADALGAALAPLTAAKEAIRADLAITGLRPLAGGSERPVAWLRGQQVLAVSGIGEPQAFAAQLTSLGAVVRPMPFGDHHPYTTTDVTRIIHAAGSGGVIVTTAKDAVKLAPLWPAHGPTCLVAVLGVTIAAGMNVMARLVDRAVALAQRSNPVSADAPPMRA